MLFGVCTRTRLLTYLPRRISANRIAVAPPLCARISMSAPTQTGDKPEPTAAAGGAGAEGQSKSAMKKAAKQAEKQAKAEAKNALKSEKTAGAAPALSLIHI